MSDSDLDDIESRLYCQVFHSVEEEPTTSYVLNAETMKRHNRYFQETPPRGEKRYRNRTFSRNRTNHNSPLRTNYYKNCPRGDISINQLVVLNPPQQELICIANSKKQTQPPQWRQKFTEHLHPPKAIEHLHPPKAATPIAEKPAPKIVPEIRPESPDVIVLCDSDEECVEIPQKWPILSVVDSDEECGTIDGANKAHSEERLNSRDKSNSAQKVANIGENSGMGQAPNKCLSNPNQNTDKSALSHTQDSNDFMNVDAEADLDEFNFSLHGTDFNSCEFAKPVTPTDTCETESSSSTSGTIDMNSMKMSVFSEVEFPKEDIFGANLEQFGKLITPLRKPEGSSSKHTSTPQKSNANVICNTYASSDSSSESDFENEHVNVLTKKLPNLSPIHPQRDCSVTKRKLNKSQLTSKYDLLNRKLTKMDSKKKSNAKNKPKRKSGSQKSDELETVEEVPSSEVENPKKRTSSQDLQDVMNKRSKTKKKSSSANYDEVVVSNPTTAEPVVSQESNTKDTSVNAITEDTQSESEACLWIIDKSAAEVNTPPIIVSDTDNNSSIARVVIEHESESIDMSSTIQVEVDDKSNILVLDSIVQSKVANPTYVHSSDSESVLSRLEGDGDDIQLLNCPTANQLSNTYDVIVQKNNKASRGLVNFTVPEIQSSMSDDPKLWTILESDRFLLRSEKGKRCNKCREHGHMAIRCPNKTEIRCKLCGRGGHYEPRCPNRICTQCGHKNTYSTTYCKLCFMLRTHRCRLCSMMGHADETCPDLWRRYHLTTNEGPLVHHNGPYLKSISNLWCSGCATSGHLEYTCRMYRGPYTPSDPHIMSYQEIYHVFDQRDLRNQLSERRQTIDYNTINQNVVQIPFVCAPSQRFEAPPTNIINPNHLYDMFNGQMMSFLNRDNQNRISSRLDEIPLFQLNQNQATHSFRNDSNVKLPDFISLESSREPEPSREPVVEERPPVATNKKDFVVSNTRWCKKINQHHIFLTSNTKDLKHFVTTKLNLLKLSSYDIENILRRVKQMRKHSRDRLQQLNMIIFGVYGRDSGKTHLNTLKVFGMNSKSTAKLTTRMRQDLYKSYSYIFGVERHPGVDYEQFLKTN